MSTKITFEHEAQVKEETYKAGDWFATEEGLMRLVSMHNGDIACLEMIKQDGHDHNGVFWNAGINVKYIRAISKEEFKIICGPLKSIERVSVEITTKPFKG